MSLKVALEAGLLLHANTEMTEEHAPTLSHALLPLLALTARAHIASAPWSAATLLVGKSKEPEQIFVSNAYNQLTLTFLFI